MPHKRKKRGGKKSKGSGEGRKQKVKDERAAKLSRKKTFEILLSAHARTLKAVIWHQEQKLVQCSTCEQRFGQFGFFSARQRPKNGLTRFERHFLAKCPGVNGLMWLIYPTNSVNKWMLLKRRMGNGEWGMGNGEWGMGNGEWGMGNEK